jgi:hypothetical protein
LISPSSSGDVGLEKTQYSLDFPFIQWGCGLGENTIHWMKGKSRLYCVFYKPTSPLDEGEIKTILWLLQAHIPTGWRGNQDYIVSSPSPHPHWMKGKSRLHCVLAKPTSSVVEWYFKTVHCYLLCLLLAHNP